MPVPKKGSVPTDANGLLAYAQKREDDVKAVFAKYDADKSNSIDATEVLCLIRELGIAKTLLLSSTV